ncbi:MAG TPA: ABC transporter permease [Myxococcales bacterium]|nr:ABC transporter permease [Myxococcales bacterium]
MRPARLWKLANANLSRELGALAVSAGGVALGIGCLVFFLSLGRGLQRVVHDVFPSSARELDVVVPAVGVGSLFGEMRLDDAAVQRLRQVPGVGEAFPRLSLRVPAVTRYNGPFFGREIRMGLEVVGEGIQAELFGADARLPFADPGEGKPIPVVVNRRLLEIYNKVFAPQRGLPQLTDSMLVGFEFPIELGRSWVAEKTLPGSYVTGLRLAGFSDRAPLAGISMPLETVRRINARFGLDSAGYSSVLLRAQRSEQVGEIAAAVKRMGFDLDESERSRALQIGAAVELVTLALSLLAALITALAAVNIAQAFHAEVRERTREIGVMRAVGATRGDVATLILAEAAVTGVFGGALGVLLARAGGFLVDRIARSSLPEFPFKPETFFDFRPTHLVVGIAIAVVASLAGAFFPARAAAALDPARALSES